VPYLLLKIFNKLTSKNIDNNIALQETLFELSYILDTIKEHGLLNFYNKISPVAFNGALSFINKLEEDKELDNLLNNTLENIINKKPINNINKIKFLNNFKKASLNFDTTLFNYNNLNKDEL